MLDPLRVASVRATRANSAPPAPQSKMPPEFAAQRAIILESEARLQNVGARVPTSKTLADVQAVNRELDEIQTAIEARSPA